MKKLALATSIMIGTFVPATGFADTLFPSLNFPTAWGSTVVVSQDLVTPTIIQITPYE